MENIELSVWAWKNVESVEPESSSRITQLFGERTGKYKLRIAGGTWELWNTRENRILGSGDFDESLFSAKTTTGNGSNLELSVGEGYIDIYEPGGGLTLFSKKHRSLARQAELVSKSPSLEESNFELELQQESFIEAIYIGGAGVPLEPRQEVTLLVDKWGFTVSQGQYGIWRKSFEELLAVQITGSGEYQTGGGWFGGGFGVVGSLQGAAFAEIMNLITTRTKVDCLFRFVYPGTDASFKVTSHTPELLEAELSGVRNWLETRNLDQDEGSSKDTDEKKGTIEQLERYFALYEKGALTKEEFESYKKSLRDD